MSKSMKKMLVLAKNQTSLGTDATPGAALNAILCSAVNIQPLNAEFVGRNLIRPTKGGSGKLVAGAHAGLDFEVELAGSGAAGTAPKFSPLLKSCYFSETVTAGVSVAYAPVSTGDTYSTLYCFLDGVKFALLDALGSVSLSLNSKGIPVQKYKFLGTYQPVTDATFPTGVDYSGFTQPKTVGKVNTPTFTIGGVASKANTFEFDIANELNWRELIGASGVQSPDRAPTLRCTLELDTMAARNWWALAEAGTTQAVQLIHGLSAGNIFQFDAPKAQISAAPTVSNDQNNAMVDVNFDLVSDAGDDEVVLTFK